jgi:hypothetical protein
VRVSDEIGQATALGHSVPRLLDQIVVAHGASLNETRAFWFPNVRPPRRDCELPAARVENCHRIDVTWPSV